jgi:hypothetical protein
MLFTAWRPKAIQVNSAVLLTSSRLRILLALNPYFENAIDMRPQVFTFPLTRTSTSTGRTSTVRVGSSRRVSPYAMLLDARLDYALSR